MGHFTWLGYIFHVGHEHIHIYHLAFTAILLTLLGLWAWSRLRKVEAAVIPRSKVGLTGIFEVAGEKLLGLLEGILGHDHARTYLPMVASIFIFIFLNNLLGILPGFLPPTENINTTLAFGTFTFLYFNYVGFKTQGMNYLKHFAGPILWLAPLIFIIEILGMLVRPISLGLRLYGNITGDHLVLNIFSGLVPLIVPIPFLLIAIFVSFMQAFVFALLSAIYISLSLPHEGEHHH